MAKVKLKTVLQTADETFQFSGIGILTQNTLKFIENEVQVVISMKEKDEVQIRRSTEQYTIFIPLKKDLTKIGIYDIKCDSIQVEIRTKANDIKIGNNHIALIYNLILGGYRQGKFIYDIWYEVME